MHFYCFILEHCILVNRGANHGGWVGYVPHSLVHGGSPISRPLRFLGYTAQKLHINYILLHFRNFFLGRETPPLPVGEGYITLPKPLATFGGSASRLRRPPTLQDRFAPLLVKLSLLL